MDQIKIYRCRICGNVVVHLYNSGMPLTCCGEEMELLESASEMASVEKHVPVVERFTDKVIASVGEMPHPMTKDHYIEWILLQTKSGFQIHYLKPGDFPIFEFHLQECLSPIAVYAYCNIHGLWVKDLKN